MKLLTEPTSQAQVISELAGLELDRGCAGEFKTRNILARLLTLTMLNDLHFEPVAYKMEELLPGEALASLYSNMDKPARYLLGSGFANREEVLTIGCSSALYSLRTPTVAANSALCLLHSCKNSFERPPTHFDYLLDVEDTSVHAINDDFARRHDFINIIIQDSMERTLLHIIDLVSHKRDLSDNTLLKIFRQVIPQYKSPAFWKEVYRRAEVNIPGPICSVIKSEAEFNGNLDDVDMVLKQAETNIMFAGYNAMRLLYINTALETRSLHSPNFLTWRC